MDKFQTNAAGNIDSGTEVLANNLTFMQNGTEKLFTDFFGNTFTIGILNTNDANTMFPLTANANGKFSVGVGTAYIFEPTTELYKRIEIDLNNMTDYDPSNPTQTTDDGTGVLVLTPKSTGCLNVPIENANVTYWIDLQYLQVCNNGNAGDGMGLKNYSIAKKINPSEIDKKRFYQWEDGYKIVLQTTKDNVQGICLGTVIRDNSDNITFAYTDKTGNLLVKAEMFLEYLTSGSGLTIDTDPVTDKTRISVNVDNDSIIINNANQLTVSNNASYPYTRFAMNSGPASIFGINLTEVFISLPINTVLQLNPAYGDIYTIDSTTQIDAIDVWTLVQQQFSGQAGTYTVCLNTIDKNTNTKLTIPKLELMNKILVGELTQITNQQQYDILIDLTDQPFETKWFDGSQWQKYNGVPLGEVEVDSGTIVNLKKFDYNTNFVSSKIRTATKYIDQQSAYNAQLSTVVVNEIPSSNIYPYALKLVDRDDKLIGDLEYIINSDGSFYGVGLIAKKWNAENFDARITVGYDSNGDPSLNFNWQPLPRLPDYSAMIQLYGSDNSDTKTIPNDGWLLIRTTANTAYCFINGSSIIDDDWGPVVPEVVFFPIKAGDIINFRYTVVYFCPYR